MQAESLRDLGEAAREFGQGGDEIVRRKACADVSSHEVLRGLEEAQALGESAIHLRDRPRVIWYMGLGFGVGPII